MASIDPMAEIRASFFVECEELLEALQESLEHLENGTSDDETINVIFRAVHSIKGGAGAFGLENLVRFSHCFETALDAARSGKIQLNADSIKVLLRCSDQLADLVSGTREGQIVEADPELTAALDLISGENSSKPEVETEIQFSPQPINFNIESLTTDLPTIEIGNHNFTIQFKPHTALYDTGNEPFIILAALAELGGCEVQCEFQKIPSLDQLDPEIPLISWTIKISTDVEEAEIRSIFEFVDGLCDLDIVRDGSDETMLTDPLPNLSDVSLATVKTPENPKQKVNSPTQSTTKSVVRVDLDRLERLVNLVGELVVNQAMLSESLQGAGFSPHSDAMVSLEEFNRLTRDIQDSVMMIRAQPVKSLFQRMSRIVREAASGVGKDVRLVTIGESTEIDKTVIERLADPLTHLIRNAVDHGVEPHQDRIDGGKIGQGTITLSAKHKSGRVLLEILDDGAGIDRARVKEIAIAKGLIDSNIEMTEPEIDNLLFLPGFSTASTVSDLSGRGVGMDVVRTAIQTLGGRISISSTEGQGTSFSISLPLTLAVLEGMVVQVDNETLVVPLTLISETLTLDTKNLKTVNPSINVVEVRGSYIPIYDLGVVLGYRQRRESYLESVALIIENGNQSPTALIVDDILDQRQVVIKGLDDNLCRTLGVSAATILGDGNIALILDPADIITAAQNEQKNQTLEGQI